MSLFGMARGPRWALMAAACAAVLGGCAATPRDAQEASAASVTSAAAALSVPGHAAGSAGPAASMPPHESHSIAFGAAAHAMPKLAAAPARVAAADPRVARLSAAASPRMAAKPAPEKAARTLDDYAVVVSAEETIRKPGRPGEMRVWIGDPQFKPATPVGMRSGETAIPAKSDTAKVTPFAPGIEVEPKESVCERIDPGGSEVRFQLKPVEKGVFKVGADVALYDSADCSGAPIPRTAATVRVEVVVDVPAVVGSRVLELLTVAWEAFLKFWGEAVALFFALLLFLLRKRLAKWFGFAPAAGEGGASD